MGDLPKGVGTAERTPVVSHSTPFVNPNPLEVGTENWAIAERATREIIRKVQPTSESEERRRKVVDYIQRLIRNSLGAEVFSYGSVPLKTYLPDGDIDLTAFGGANAEDTLADDMKSVFEEEEKNKTSEFVVKDVQIIRAEVKLVKCIAQDIVVDVSFNQIGGLCTLCFLEQVDRFIGKEHLFKRSVILIKAWCYYESRILGAHHGLISTYALETLVLYIFHLFHSTLDGPLAVLYKFLDYFSKFDWDNYCISLNGPVCLSSLPAIVAEMPEGSGKDLLLSNGFLSSCVGMFSVPSRDSDKTSRGFQRKHLNIVDPLKEINNLGRSVSQGNFYRIRSAFSYGARKLTRILLQPKNSIANELHKFFSNTMVRHGGGQRPDVQDFESSLICKRLVSGVHGLESFFKTDNSYEFDGYATSTGNFQSTSGKLSQDLLQEMESPSDTVDREQHSKSVFKHPRVLLDRNQASKPSTLDPCFHGDSDDLATCDLGCLKISTDSSRCQTPLPKESSRALGKHYYAAHSNLSNSKLHDGDVRDVNKDLEWDKSEKNNSSLDSPGYDGERVAVVGSLDEQQLVDNNEAVDSSKPKDIFRASKSSSISEDPNHMDLERGSAGRSETPGSSSSSDLAGDYEDYWQCLQYGKWCYEYGLCIHSMHIPPLPTTLYQNNGLWDGLLPMSRFKQNGFSHQHPNGFHLNPAIYAVQPIVLPGVAFGWDEVAKPRGTGTYFPNMNQPPQGYRSSAMKGRNQAPSRSPRNNGRKIDPSVMDRSSQELSQPQVPVDKSLMVGSSDSHLSFSPRGHGFPSANGMCIQPEGVDELDLVGYASGASMSEKNRRQRPVSLSPRALSGTQRSQPSLIREQERISLRSSYHLKDEGDFPPLSVCLEGGNKALSYLITQ